MTNDFWQRRAPIMMLFAVVTIMAAAIWWQAGKQLPVRAPASAPQATTGQPLSGLSATSATDAFKPSIRPANSDPDQSDHEQKPVSDQDLQTQLVEQLGQLDRKFKAEPVSAAWSGNAERMIETAFSDAGLAVNQAPKPVAHDAECRTFSCRIRVTYRNEMDAQMGEVFLLGDIAKQLPSAQFGRLAAADGTIQIVMYATTGHATKQH